MNQLVQRPLNKHLIFREFRDVGAGLVQVLVQQRNCVEHALLLVFELGNFLALFGEVRFQFLEGGLLFLDLGVRLLGGSHGYAHKQAQHQGDKAGRQHQPTCSFRVASKKLRTVRKLK